MMSFAGGYPVLSSCLYCLVHLCNSPFPKFLSIAASIQLSLLYTSTLRSTEWSKQSFEKAARSFIYFLTHKSVKSLSTPCSGWIKQFLVVSHGHLLKAKFCCAEVTKKTRLWKNDHNPPQIQLFLILLECSSFKKNAKRKKNSCHG